MPSPQQIAIYGAGGFGREVAWLLSEREDAGEVNVSCFIEDGLVVKRVLNGKPVLSFDDFRARNDDALLAIAVGDPRSRRHLAAKSEAAGYAFATLIHRSVQKSEFVQIGSGAIICAGSIITVNITIARHAHINLDCTIGHDVRIGDFATIAPGVHVSGNVHIGCGAYIGTGATIVNGSSDQPLLIGEGAVIAAGACVTKSTAANALYAGIPAVIKKEVPEW
ncbi:MAG: acetyltransferase [Gemmatimonadaceae bacterium]